MAAVPVDDAMPELICFLSTMSLAETHDNRTLPLILELPTEIISMICEYLDDKSLARCRQMCRGLADKSTLTFGPRFFGSIIAILHPISLGILEGILSTCFVIEVCQGSLDQHGAQGHRSICVRHLEVHPHICQIASQFVES
jgi:hypothetical protein